MTHLALKLFEGAEVAQTVRNQARNIRIKIEDARGNREDAGIRWPFELLQNALDAGPRPGRETVDVSFLQENGRFVFRHDGAFFRVQELAALLSGGSSKDYDASDTTGRFGTGFLVTHVLAPRVDLRGLLLVEDGAAEAFALSIDRRGDEAAIGDNIQHCRGAVRDAIRVESTEGIFSAELIYVDEDVASLAQGMEALRDALPYLFVTCPQLGQVQIHRDDLRETWTPGPVTSVIHGEAEVQERSIRIDELNRELRVVGASARGQAASALVALEKLGSGWAIIPPAKALSRLFCRYPIRSWHFLPMNVVLNGRFDVDQERRRVHLKNEHSQSLLRAALDSSIALVEFAYDQGWEGRHLLAKVARVDSLYSNLEAEESEWLNSELRRAAEQLARKPLIETSRGYACAINVGGTGSRCDFVVARLTEDVDSGSVPAEPLGKLVGDVIGLRPPTEILSQSWSEIADGWAGLRVAVSQISLSRLVRFVLLDARCLEELPVDGDRHDWLSRLLDLVGRFWKRHGVTKALVNGLLPDQEGRLASGSDLRLDLGVSEDLKDIAEELGERLRSRLLDHRLAEPTARLGLADADYALNEVLSGKESEQDAIRACVERLELLQDGTSLSEKQRPLLLSTIRLLGYLWETQREEAAQSARKLPLLNRAGKVIHVSATERVMVPVSAWAESARVFRGIYPEHRVLAEEYQGDGKEIPNITVALVEWGMAHGDPLSTQRSGSSDLGAQRLRVIVANPQDSDGVDFSAQDFSQIALLHEILPRCEASEDLARNLLGLVLTSIAPRDPEWRTTRLIGARRDEGEADLQIRRSLWLADLRTRAWVPAPGENGSRTKVIPSADSLKPLIDPAWLDETATELLTRFFDFDVLDVGLLTVTSETSRGQIRRELARLVGLLGSDPTGYSLVISELEHKRLSDQQRQLFLNLGRAVQDAVERLLSAAGLEVELVDRGYDFEVSCVDIADPAYRFLAGHVLVEVKATTSEAVRMTPAQAASAGENSERYALCVVDLRQVPRARLEEEWTWSDVAKHSRITSDISEAVGGTSHLIQEALQRAQESKVRITGMNALRFEVPSNIWEHGLPIADWIRRTWGKELP
jgi:hypothetical protein